MQRNRVLKVTAAVGLAALLVAACGDDTKIGTPRSGTSGARPGRHQRVH